MLALRRIYDFVALRPFFTRGSLQAFWWCYIFVKVDALYELARHFHFAVNEGVWLALGKRVWIVVYLWIGNIFTPLDTLVTLASVRLLLEVLMRQLAASEYPSPPTHPDRSVRVDLAAFLDLRPFFTIRYVRAFWLLFLLTVLRDVYFKLIELFPPGQSYAASISVRDFIWLLRLLCHAACIRMLVEAALAGFPQGDEADAGPRRVVPMRWVIDFFAVSPMFTLPLLRALWWACIFLRLTDLAARNWSFPVYVPGPPPSWAPAEHYVGNTLEPFYVFAGIAAIRLLFEALIPLLPNVARPSQGVARERAWQQPVLDFVLLRPFHKVWWLWPVWGLLLTQVFHNLFGAFLYHSADLRPPGSLQEWHFFLTWGLTCMTYLAGVRLLMETVMFRQQAAPGPQATKVS